MTNLTVGSLHTLHLDGLALGGEAVGRIDDLVVFVPYGAPGDTVEIRIMEVKKTYARGEINRVLKPSAHRVKPPCPIFYSCGGCQFQHMTYGSQLLHKKKMVEDAIVHLGKLENVWVEDVVEASDPWNYRNKMQVVAAAKPFLPPSTKVSPYFGLYAKKTHRVIRMDECLIQHPLSNRIIKAAKDAVTRLNWEVYNEKTEKGILRYLITRISAARNQVLLMLVATTLQIPGISEFVNSLTKKVPELRGIVLNKNDKKTNVILGSVNKTIWGSDYLMEEIGGIIYRVSANSFFQVNPPQLEKMFLHIENFLEPDKGEVLLDAYCGVGAVALRLASKFRKVVGIEEIDQARKDALESAELNNVGNMEIQTGLVEKVLPKLYHQGVRFDKAVLDPPRKGCAEEVLNTVAKMRIRKIAYISCNPATLARDLAILQNHHYRVEGILPLDMFPQTAHVECIARLVHDPPSFLRKAKQFFKIEETAEEKKPETKAKRKKGEEEVPGEIPAEKQEQAPEKEQVEEIKIIAEQEISSPEEPEEKEELAASPAVEKEPEKAKKPRKLKRTTKPASSGKKKAGKEKKPEA